MERGGRGETQVQNWNHQSPVGDIIFINGRVITGDMVSPAGNSGVAIRAGKIAAVGSDEDVLAWRGKGVDVIDLNGRAIAPGLNDAHCHPMYVGFSLAEVDARTPPNVSVADIVAGIQARVRETPKGEWVTARGYDHARLAEQRHPNRHDLDAVSPDHPVLVVRACGHIAAANSVYLWFDFTVNFFFFFWVWGGVYFFVLKILCYFLFSF